MTELELLTRLVNVTEAQARKLLVEIELGPITVGE